MSGKGRQRIDLKGQRFERLVAEDFFVKEYDNGIKKTIWNCICDCGNNSQVSTADLRNGHSRSCGCLKNETTAKRNFKHGYSKGDSPEYNSWQSAKSRCFNSGTPNYEYYGGRGISMATRWVESFEEFFKDMGERPEGFSLERVDVDGDICPENCIWADGFTQAQNRRINSLNSTGKTGVSWSEGLKKYEAYIGVEGKHVRLLQTKDFELACFVRREAELTYYGKYSNS